MKRPDRFPQSLDRLASSSAHGLYLTRVTVKPVRSETWKVNALRELQVKGGAPKGVLREGVAPVRWADVDGARAANAGRVFKGEL